MSYYLIGSLLTLAYLIPIKSKEKPVEGRDIILIGVLWPLYLCVQFKFNPIEKIKELVNKFKTKE